MGGVNREYQRSRTVSEAYAPKKKSEESGKRFSIPTHTAAYIMDLDHVERRNLGSPVSSTAGEGTLMDV